MRYFANTLVQYISEQVEKNSGLTLRFVLPSYPAELLLELGQNLREALTRLSKRSQQNITFEYGIAYGLGQRWLKGTEDEKRLFSEIKDEGWYNDTDNLTSLRHLQKRPDEDSLVVLFAGYDDIRDQSSLEDFFHLDQYTVWAICLHRTFESWIAESLRRYVNPDGNEDWIRKIACFFGELYEHGLADPLQVSYYLESKNFGSAYDGEDAFKLVLSDLRTFGLPNMTGLEKRSAEKFSQYITAARRFMSYDTFLEDRQKKSAKKKINEFLKDIEDEPSQEVLGGFSNVNELVDSLCQYIETGSLDHLRRLEKAAFPYIDDQILKYKSRVKKLPSQKETVTNLRGHALEVFLEGLWLTLSDFKEESEELLVLNDLNSISLRSLEYQHHFESDGDDLGEEFLRRLIGGIDEYLEGHIEIGASEHYAEVDSGLAPDRSDLKYRAARATTEPRLVFEVTVRGISGAMVQRKFAWLLGENTQARFLVNLYDWATEHYGEDCWLPAFSCEYVNEVFMAKDAEDAVRILSAGLEKETGCVHELVPSSEREGRLHDQLSKTALSYQEFIYEYSKAGFFSALTHKFDSLRHAYAALMEGYLQQNRHTDIGSALVKAFMIVPKEFTETRGWEDKEYLRSSVVTPLHPALLQMIYHQHAYLCYGFCTYARQGLGETRNRRLPIKDWHRILDLSHIKWPVVGILDENKNPNINVRSYDYVHLVGTPSKEYSTVASRLLVDRKEDDDEDITDAELFRETQESNLIKHVLFDYCKLHPYANDGLSIGVYCGGSIQHIIGGIDAFLSEIAADRDGNPYSMNLVVFSDSPDDAGILKWINAWKERWQLAEGSAPKKHYANSHISLLYRVVPENDVAQLKRQIQSVDLDVFFFSSFTTPRRSEFYNISDERLFHSDIHDYLKFPVLEKANCLIEGRGASTERRLVLSNRQFQLGALHVEVMARLCNPSMSEASGKHVIVSTTDFELWREVIDAAHDQCVWVVCIDPIVDEKLIRESDKDREIIGFGTGVGPHGEFNFTISTEQFQLSDIEKRMSDQLDLLLPSQGVDVSRKIASSLVREGLSMSGLSIVKATSRDSEYVRDFIAYSLVRKLLPKSEGALCDEIVSLDGFLHWFDFGPQNMRPDLLRLQVVDNNGTLEIKAQIIECKLARQSEGYLEKALQQVQEGLNQLVPRFRPRQSETPIGIELEDEDRHKRGLPPDQRYWWIQLHRLISSRGEIPRDRQDQVIQALELLSDGYFNIEWEAGVVALWTDLPNEQVLKEAQATYATDGQELVIFSIQCGRDFVRKAVLEGTDVCTFDGSSVLRYEHIKPLEVEVPGVEDGPEKKVEPELPEAEIHTQHGPTQTRIATEVKKIPDRILLGNGTIGGPDAYWEFGHPELPNRHLLIFGASGTGKTYTIQTIISELSRCGINSLIVDYTSGFTNQQLESIVVERLQPKQHIVRKAPLPINPFRKQSYLIDDVSLQDTSAQVAQRVTGVFSEVFRLGEQQKAVLYDVICTGVEELGEGFNLRILLDRLDEVRAEGGVLANPATTVANKMRSFVDSNPFGQEDPESWERLFTDPVSRCHIIQLTGFMKDSARLITEFSLIDLYWYYRTKGSKDDPRVIVLDEIQNLDHSLESPLGQLLTEGRKFGISLILATQTLSNFSKDERDRLFQASHKLFFKPADTEIKSFAQLLADATNYQQDHWITQLSSLKRGECFSLGHARSPSTDKLAVNKTYKIRVKSLEERFG